jgi:hypothetical protein
MEIILRFPVQSSGQKELSVFREDKGGQVFNFSFFY